MSAECVAADPCFWLNRPHVEEAEIQYHLAMTASKHGGIVSSAVTSGGGSSIASEIEKVRNQIKQSLNTDITKAEKSTPQPEASVLERLPAPASPAPALSAEPSPIPQSKGKTVKNQPLEIRTEKIKILGNTGGDLAEVKTPGKKSQAVGEKGKAASSAADSSVINRIVTLERENQELRQVTSDLQSAVKKLETKLAALEVSGGGAKQAAAKPAPVKPAVEDDESDDDCDLFGDDDESEDDEEKERLKQERLDAYAARKSKKPALIAKSNIILDVKPWDDETDMAEMEKCVRSITMDGLLWGASQLVAVGYGIRKLQISCVVEDDKVSTEDLEDQIVAFEDFIQSMDIAAFNKV